MEEVQRPVGVLLAPATGDGWQLEPTFSLDAIRALATLGATIDGDLRAATLPVEAIPQLLARWNPRTLHAGPREHVDSARALADALTRELGRPVAPGAPDTPLDRWGRVLVHRRSHTAADGHEHAELGLRVVTLTARRLPRRRLGSAPFDEFHATRSAVMELGEAVQTAIEHGLPLLLVLRGRPANSRTPCASGARRAAPACWPSPPPTAPAPPRGASSPSRRSPNCASSSAPAPAVTLDAGARQLVRMVLARPLADDPVLLGRQRDLAALKVVGSGVDASQTGTGKTITSGRALAHRAATTPRLRAMIVAEGRLLAQWRDELLHGAPARGLPPLAPNIDVLVLDDHGPPAGQLRRFDRELGERARRRPGGQRRARPPPRRTGHARLARPDRRRGPALRQPRHRSPPGARAGCGSDRSPTAGY